MGEKIKRLILCYIPTNQCNLKCEYCIVSQVDGWHDQKEYGFKYPVDHIVKALSKNRLGGTCYINLTAQGETLLYKDIVQLTKGLLAEGHYVEIVTNATVSKRIDEILEFPKEQLSRLFFKCSYHYAQMNGKQIENVYWRNIKRIEDSPASFTIELMPHDEIAGEIDRICNKCKENAGATCHATVGRSDTNGKELLTKYTQEEYEHTWSKLNSAMFKLKMQLFMKKRTEFCYAGRWSLLIDISTGEASQCYGRLHTQNVFKNLNKRIRFIPVGYTCRQPFCFNGHAHVAWGIIPELNSPFYYEVRNRICDNGKTWVKNDCAEFFKHKLVESNQEYSNIRKIANSVFMPFYMFVCFFGDIPGHLKKVRKAFRILKKKRKH